MSDQKKAGLAKKDEMFLAFIFQEEVVLTCIPTKICAMSSTQTALEARRNSYKPLLFSYFVQDSFLRILLYQIRKIFLHPVLSQKSPCNKQCNRLKYKASLVKLALFCCY